MAAPKTCAGCGRDFEPSRSDATYCLPACRQRAYRKRAPWPEGFERAERALIAQLKARRSDPEDALDRIVRAWKVAV